MEGGVDEELDYDVTEDFQDDDENNTFYHDQEEEEETKYQEVCTGIVEWLPVADDFRSRSRRSRGWLMRLLGTDPRSTTQTTRMMTCLARAS
jgi:hypothetical protein